MVLILLEILLHCSLWSLVGIYFSIWNWNFVPLCFTVLYNCFIHTWSYNFDIGIRLEFAKSGISLNPCFLQSEWGKNEKKTKWISCCSVFDFFFPPEWIRQWKTVEIISSSVCAFRLTFLSALLCMCVL